MILFICNVIDKRIYLLLNLKIFFFHCDIGKIEIYTLMHLHQQAYFTPIHFEGINLEVSS